MAVPVVKDVMQLEGHERVWRQSGRRDTSDSSLLFGGHPVPELDMAYHVTIKDNHDSCHAISMMKVCQRQQGRFTATVN